MTRVYLQVEQDRLWFYDHSRSLFRHLPSFFHLPWKVFPAGLPDGDYVIAGSPENYSVICNAIAMLPSQSLVVANPNSIPNSSQSTAATRLLSLYLSPVGVRRPWQWNQFTVGDYENYMFLDSVRTDNPDRFDRFRNHPVSGIAQTMGLSATRELFFVLTKITDPRWFHSHEGTSVALARYFGITGGQCVARRFATNPAQRKVTSEKEKRLAALLSLAAEAVDPATGRKFPDDDGLLGARQILEYLYHSWMLRLCHCFDC